MKKINNYYAIKDVGSLIIKNKDADINIDVASEIHTIETDRINILILSMDLTSDILEEQLNKVRKSEFNLKLSCKTALAGDYTTKERVFKNMSFVKREIKYSYEKPSVFLFVFANKKYNKIKDVLDDYLTKNMSNSNSEYLNNILGGINEGISLVNYALKDLDLNLASGLKKVLKDEVVKEINSKLIK